MPKRQTTGKKRKRVTQQDIAHACGLSVIAVSYALRGNRQFVSEETIRRVRAEARRLGYNASLSHAARSLRYQGSTQRVVSKIAALFFPYENLESRYWTRILQGIQRGFAAAQYGVLSCHVDITAGSITDQLPVVLHRGDVDGAVIFATESYREQLIEALRNEPGFGPRPIVTLTQAFPGCSAVVFDDVEIGRLSAGHLLDLGHRHLLCFRSTRITNAIVDDRLEGFRRAYRERGLDPEEGLHFAPFIWDLEWQETIGFEAAAHMALERNPAVTALLCPNDQMGIQLVRVLRRLGYRVPRDLSAIGVDDCDELLSEKDENIWTTIRIPLQQMGIEAANLLMNEVEQDEGEVARPSVVLPVSLVVRGTTGPPASPASADPDHGRSCTDPADGRSG